MRTGLVVARWSGLLVSAVSEYGFDLDFPLTPPLWLAIAVCVWLICSVHTSIACRTEHITNRVEGAQWAAKHPSLTEPGIWADDPGNSASTRSSHRFKENLDHRVLRVRRGFEDSPQDCPNIPATGITPLNLFGEVVGVPETVQGVTRLSPAAARGPPWASTGNWSLDVALPDAPICTSPFENPTSPTCLD